MRNWLKAVVAIGFILISALLVLTWPVTSLAAPQGPLMTPLFLPIVLKNYPPITSTIPITVGPVVEQSELIVFSPMSVTIHAGDTVHWVWGSTGHTVTSGTPPNADNQFCSPNNTGCSTINTSSAGATYDHQFLVPGTYQYFCQIHWPFGMTGTINVVQ